MKANYLPGLLLSGAMMCSAQTAALSDPTLDSAGLPGYLKLLAQPATEPWHKITETERFNYYASITFAPYAGLASMFGGAISQALDSPHEWGQGGGAYRTRVASSYGSTFVAYTITYGAGLTKAASKPGWHTCFFHLTNLTATPANPASRPLRFWAE